MTVHVRAPAAAATIIPIRRAGVVAAEFCKTVARAEVAAVFARSFYLRSGDLFVCIGEPGIGNGPLTLTAPMRVAGLDLRLGAPATIAADSITIGRLTLTNERSEVWRRPPWPAASPNLRAVATVAQRAAAEAPIEGFGRAMLPRHAADDAFARVAQPRLADLERRLAHPTASDAVRRLVGLGHGLTPSGDDVIVGALALLAALAASNAQARIAHTRLTQALDQIPPGPTSPLSHCFLRVAAAGHVGEHLHAVIAALICGDADAAIASAQAIGHSSGWDMLAGAVTALSAVSDAAVLTPLGAADSRNR
jgi:hypothetical protein